MLPAVVKISGENDPCFNFSDSLLIMFAFSTFPMSCSTKSRGMLRWPCAKGLKLEHQKNHPPQCLGESHPPCLLICASVAPM